MEKMILTKGEFVINAFTKAWNYTCTMALPVNLYGNEFYLMYRAETSRTTPTETIILN